MIETWNLGSLYGFELGEFENPQSFGFLISDGRCYHDSHYPISDDWINIKEWLK